MGAGQKLVADRLIDARGLKCPLPLLKAGKTLKAMPEGARLEVLSTDPVSVLDFEAFCEKGGHQLLERQERNGVFHILIAKGAVHA